MKINGYDIKKNSLGLYEVSRDDELFFTYPSRAKAIEAAETDLLHEGE
jgi:hypothetical protein